MKLNLEKIIKVYGEEYIQLINENIVDVKENITYLLKIGLTDVEDIFARYPHIFITSNVDFKNKIKLLVKKLGINYIDIIENNLELLEEL